MKKKIVKWVSLILIGFSFLFCDFSKKAREPEINSLNLNAIDSINVYLGLPANLNAYKNHLFINDFYGENGFIQVIDLNTDNLIFSFAKKGNGPNEYLSVSNIDIYEDSNSIIIGLFDVNLKKYNEYDYGDLLLNKEVAIPYNSKTVSIPYTVNEVFKIKKGYIATGFFPDGKFALLNDSLRLLKYLCNYRPKPQKNITDILNARANLGTSSLSSNKKLLANAIFKANVLEFYSIENDSIYKAWDYVIKEIDYNVFGSSIRNNTVEGFISVRVVNNFIYALYSGEEDTPNKNATYGREIYKFNKEGKLIDLYVLDRDAIDIEIKENKLYALIHIPEPKVLIYQLTEGDI